MESSQPVEEIAPLLRLGRDAAPDKPDAESLAQWLAETAEFEAVRAWGAGQAARNEYLPRGGGAPEFGRLLNDETLVRTGVAAWLQSAPENDALVSVAIELAGFLAGPAVPVWRYLGLDANVEVRGGPVALAEWELVVPGETELRSLLPVPTASTFAPREVLPPESWDQMAFLRRRDPELKASAGLRFHWPPTYPERVAWLPILVLCCWDHDVVTAWCEYVVEPARRVDRVFESVSNDIRVWDDIEVELPFRSSVGINPGNEAAFRRHCAALIDRFQCGATDQKRTNILRNAAFRYLAAGEHAFAHPVPLDPERLPDAVVNLVAAMEGLAMTDGGRESIARTVAQRVAVLVGDTDDQRRSIWETVKKAYGARSDWAHGTDVKDSRAPDVGELRRLVGRLFMAWVAVTAEVSPKQLAAECDAALLSDAHRERLREPILRMQTLIAAD